MHQFISMATTILEQCRVAPAPGAAAELLLPLTYCDVPCLPLTPLEHLFFYAFPCSDSHFSETIVPELKHSLSITLKHFSPLAGNIIFPLASETMPVSHYVAGDPVSLTIALSDAHLGLLMAKNLSRDADQFHDLVARFPPATYSPEFAKFSVAAIQTTLFPDQGICIGITTHHAIADGSTVLNFLAIWSSIAKSKGDDTHLLGKKLLPYYDRRGVQDADTLTKACWDLIKTSSPMVSSINFSPTNKVRATFVLSEAQLRILNDSVVEKNPSLARLSSFAILCAHVWTSLARSAAGEEVADDEPEYIVCPADIRGRLNPPLPHTYFGNCLALSIAESTHGRLKGEQGIFVAAVAIWEAVRKTVNSEKGILDGFVERLQEIARVEQAGNRVFWIAGSPRFDVYVADFGWGSPESYELVNTDCTGSVFLAKSKEFEGGVEITLSRPKAVMDAFAAIFTVNLQVSKL